MERKNLFILNYSRIEHEIIKLSQSVDFCDDQIDVYSAVICDLIIRCGMDIESLYKELYRQLASEKLPKTVGEAIFEVNKYLGLVDKILMVNNTKFNFRDYGEIQPFNYKNRTGDDFYYIFCCLKHDRQKSFEKATLRTLISALGALYILNQYYLDERQLIENTFFGETVPVLLSKDTDVFSAPVYNKTWSNIDSKLNSLSKQAGLSTEDGAKLKDILARKTNIQPTHYTPDACLFRVEATPEYTEMTKVFAAGAVNNSLVKEAIITQLFGDDKDVSNLLERHGVDVFDATLSMLNITSQRYRLRIVTNKK